MFLQKIYHSFNTRQEQNCLHVNNQYYSYNQFAELVGAIAENISQLRCTQKCFGVVLDGSAQMYASVIALWATRNVFVPINPDLPFERNQSIVQQSSSIGILFNEEHAAKEDFEFTNTLNFIDTSSVVSTENFSFFETVKNVEYHDDDTLYILFTSGSTGIPKGVPISTKNLTAFIDSYNHLGFSCNENDKFLQMFELTFDVSIASFVVPLQLGASIYTINKAGVKYLNIYKTLRDYQITFASLVPSVLNFLKQYFKEINLPHLKYCVLTAEASNAHVVKEFSKCIPNAQIINLYGPTEATIWCTAYFVNTQHILHYNEMLIIGKPFKNVEVIIVDDNNNIVTNGTKGELCLCSTQLTSGYLNNDEKNHLSFFIKNNQRFYKTGDLCFLDEDENIFYCGRIDNQVKVQGYRIELSEIEVCVRNEFNAENAVITINNKFDSKILILFMHNAQENLQDSKEEIALILNRLKEKLPYYMVPEKIYFVNEFPLNNSGKLDRVELQKIALQYASSN